MTDKKSKTAKKTAATKTAKKTAAKTTTKKAEALTLNDLLNVVYYHDTLNDWNECAMIPVKFIGIFAGALLPFLCLWLFPHGTGLYEHTLWIVAFGGYALAFIMTLESMRHNRDYIYHVLGAYLDKEYHDLCKENRYYDRFKCEEHVAKWACYIAIIATGLLAFALGNFGA